MFFLNKHSNFEKKTHELNYGSNKKAEYDENARFHTPS